MADSESMRRRVEAVYHPELLRAAGHRLIDLLADHATQVQAGRTTVLNWREPAENIAAAAEMLGSEPPPLKVDPIDREALHRDLAERFGALVQTMLARGHNLHHPHYIGHQVPASVPLAGLFDAVGAVTNQVMAIYEMGPWATAVERSVIEALGEQVGFERGAFAGLITHGGSLANLTALLTARNVALAGSWDAGLAGSGPAPALVVQADAHYSVARTAGLLGLGTGNIVRAPLDVRRRMDPQRLDELLAELKRERRTVVAVCACACATPIGAFDPLPDVAAVCLRHQVWLHVDAAHGGAACLSPRYRHLVSGLELADSVVVDAHKMMFVPALCAFVFYRNREHQFEAFRQEAPYLFDPSAPGLAEYDSGLRTVECTKRAAAFGLWGLWSLFGRERFSDLVELTFDLGRRFHELLRDAPDFEPLHEPECNIVAFRHVPHELRDAPTDRLGAFQLELRRDVVRSGEFYIVPIKLDGTGALRVTIINPLTTEDHLRQLLDTLRERGRMLLQGTS